MITRYRTAALVIGGLLLAVWLAPKILAAEVNPSVRLDGAPLRLDVPAVLDTTAGRTLVPVRHLAEALGFTVTWFPEARTVRVDRADKQVTFQVGAREAEVNGEAVPLDVAPRLVKGRVLVPLRFFAELAGAEVAWDEGTQSIDLISPTSRAVRSEAGWASAQGNERRTGHNGAATFGGRAVPVWQVPMSASDVPVAGNGMIFFNGMALNRENGALLWTSELAAGATATYDAARGQVYLSTYRSDSNKVYALDASSGQVRWFAAVPTRYHDSAQVLHLGKQVIAVASDDYDGTNHLISFDADTGSKLWVAHNVRGVGQPAAHGARIFLADGFGGVYAYRAADGTPLWSHPSSRNGWEPGHGLLVDNGAVYYAGAGTVKAYDEATGRLLWERHHAGAGAGIASDGSALWLSMNDGLLVLDAATGDQLRYPAICSTRAATPVISRSHAFTACDGSIYAIDRESFAVTQVGAGQGPLALDGDRLYHMAGRYESDRALGVLMALPNRE